MLSRNFFRRHPARAEAALKANLKFSEGKFSLSISAEAGVSVGKEKQQYGLAGSVEQVRGSYDMKSNTLGGAEPVTTEWVAGGKNGGSQAAVTPGTVSVGGEEGESVVAGGEASITKKGADSIKQAAVELVNTLFTPPPPPPAPPSPPSDSQDAGSKCHDLSGCTEAYPAAHKN